MRQEEMRVRLEMLLQAKVQGDAGAIRTLARFYDALSPGLLGWIRGPDSLAIAPAMNDNA